MARRLTKVHAIFLRDNLIHSFHTGGDDDKNWKKLRAYLLRDRNTILDAIQAFDAHAHRAALAELQAQYFAEVRP